MSFPLFHTPGTIIFLDDDPDYLDMLALVLPPQWHIELYVRPHDCIERLHVEPPRWEADAWTQQQIIERWRDGSPLIPQILRYWNEHPGRYDLTRVLVVDYSMPAMDGLQVLDGIVDWPGSRVLLTGQADEQIAVNAFNRGLIDQFIAKQMPDISRRLVEAVQRLLVSTSERQSRSWRATLTPEQTALLRSPAVVRELNEGVAKRWVEHVVIGEPFGILGMDAQGTVDWLQLEDASRLADLAELAEAADLPGQAVADIRQGRKLADLELRQSLGMQGPAVLSPAFPLGREGALLGALFTIDATHAPRPENCYAAWLAQQPERTVRD
ncbi:response regulator [Variovorax sp. VNK109]|jgi:CheY-like chemotaxis protein|uniref:response regulator n=1 Tax=Variovorax sp. VNK109 TaxID=3400919 RepID=UPI003C0A955B